MSYKLIAFIFFEIIFLIKGEQVNQIKTSIRQLQSCGDGKYFDSSSNVCSDCIANCKTCLSNDKCQFCQSTYFLNYSDSTCVDCKQDGVYIELYLCKKCDISCKQCSGFLDTQCTACYDGLYLDKTSGKCTNCLQQGVYKTLDKMCLKCDTSCKNCSGGDANQCTECEDGFFLQKDLSNNPNTCQKCHISCNTCDGATQNNCLSCSNGLLKLYKGTEFQKQCTNCNNINVFKDNDVCQLCESSCVACLSKNNCQGCVDGYYQNQQNTICDQCHPTCRQCSSSFFNNCIACYSNSYLKSDNTCQLCDQSCQGCKGPTNLDCNDCNIGYSFKYQECIKCDNSCAKCNGEVPTQCKKCYDNKYLTIEQIQNNKKPLHFQYIWKIRIQLIYLLQNLVINVQLAQKMDGLQVDHIVYNANNLVQHVKSEQIFVQHALKENIYTQIILVQNAQQINHILYKITYV
ncbi:hypothetical protein ABPG73_012335 [Tetrahymena malaccensis]